MSKHNKNWNSFLNGIASADAEAARKAMQAMAAETRQTSANPQRNRLLRSIQYHQSCVDALIANPNRDRFDNENLSYHVGMAAHKRSLLY